MLLDAPASAGETLRLISEGQIGSSAHKGSWPVVAGRRNWRRRRGAPLCSVYPSVTRDHPLGHQALLSHDPPLILLMPATVQANLEPL
jgi:hypothetical protein